LTALSEGAGGAAGAPAWRGALRVRLAPGCGLRPRPGETGAKHSPHETCDRTAVHHATA